MNYNLQRDGLDICLKTNLLNMLTSLLVGFFQSIEKYWQRNRWIQIFKPIKCLSKAGTCVNKTLTCFM